MSVIVTYRLLSFDFRRFRPKAMFNGALLKHGGWGNHSVEVFGAPTSKLSTTPAQVQKYLDEIDGRELLAVHYQIIVTDSRTGRRLAAPLAFCHPFPRGTGVRLAMLPNGNLVIRRDGGRKFYSDGFTLPDLMNDDSLPKQKAYQFHE